MTRRKRRRVGRAQKRAAARWGRAYAAEMRGKKGFWHDMRLIWSSRTHFGHRRRSWFQKLIRW